MASISKREDRRKPWLVQWREPGTKAQRWKAFTTKREADAFKDQVSTDIRHGTYAPIRAVAFADYAKDWLARRRPTIGPNTNITYEWAVGRLIDEFAATPIQNLRAEQIERWQAGLLTAAVLSARSVQIIRNTLGAILTDARRKGTLVKNVMEAVQRIDVPKRELRYLTVEQLGDLCRLVGANYGVLFLVLAFCGLRMGEALGLQWPDIENGRLFVRRQLLWRRRKDCAPGALRWTFAEPKSAAGTRMVELPDVLRPFLLAHREAQNGSPNPHGLVFCNGEGGPLDGRNVRRRHFQPALARMGIAGIRPHDFRRTFIAMHVESGTHPKLVQSRVGHSDIRLTMDTYGKLAGDVALGTEQSARFNRLAARALPDPGKHLVNASHQNGLQQPEAA